MYGTARRRGCFSSIQEKSDESNTEFVEVISLKVKREKHNRGNIFVLG